MIDVRFDRSMTVVDTWSGGSALRQARSDAAQVAQRLLRRADAPLAPRERVAEGDQEPPVALALERREREDAREVVAHLRVLLLRVVTDRMEAVRVHLAHHVEQERVDVVVEGLVIEK